MAVTTIVSTDMATPVAAKYGVELRRTLTGFKFIGEQIGLLEAAGEADRYIFGFEESYGYLSGAHVRDKDAVNATLLVCEAAAWYAKQGMTLLDAINKLYAEFGCYRNALHSFAFEGESGMHTMDAIMKQLRHADPENKVGFVSTGRICYPVSEAKADVDAARGLTFACPDDDWAFTHTMALDPVCLGRWPEPDICGPRLAASIAAVPQYINDALPLGKPDMVGLNIYNAAPAQMGENGPSYVERPAGYAHTAMNWPVEPECLNWGPRQMQERYGLPMFITENGLSCTDKVYRDGKVHDADRIDFLARYLEKLSEGIHAGADVRGYFQWSLLDNFEWHSGYRERFGLVYVDYATGQRIPKDSAFWYGEVAATNGQSI